MLTEMFTPDEMGRISGIDAKNRDTEINIQVCQDFIDSPQTASKINYLTRLEGIKEKVVIWKHAFRNSMISVVTVVGLQFGFLLGGSVVTETVFAYPGLGSLLIESVNYRDYPAIQSLILIFSLQFIVINLIVDILYAVLNPEIKLQ